MTDGLTAAQQKAWALVMMQIRAQQDGTLSDEELGSIVSDLSPREAGMLLAVTVDMCATMFRWGFPNPAEAQAAAETLALYYASSG